jgi:hypothetical protein
MCSNSVTLYKVKKRVVYILESKKELYTIL